MKKEEIIFWLVIAILLFMAYTIYSNEQFEWPIPKFSTHTISETCVEQFPSHVNSPTFITLESLGKTEIKYTRYLGYDIDPNKKYIFSIIIDGTEYKATAITSTLGLLVKYPFPQKESGDENFQNKILTAAPTVLSCSQSR